MVGHVQRRVFRHVERCQPRHVWRHLVDGEPDVMEVPLLPFPASPASLTLRVRLVLLGHTEINQERRSQGQSRTVYVRDHVVEDSVLPFMKTFNDLPT